MESDPLLPTVPHEETLLMNDDYLNVRSTSAQRVRRFLRIDASDPIGYQLAYEPVDDFIFGPPNQTSYYIRQQHYAPYPNDALTVNSPDSFVDSFGYFGRFEAVHSADSYPMDLSAETSASSSLLALENPFDFELSLAELTENLSENPLDRIDCYNFVTPNNLSITVSDSETARFDFFENSVQTSKCSYEIAGYSQQHQQQMGDHYNEQIRPDNYKNLSLNVNYLNANDKPAISSSTRTAELIRRNLEICEQLSPLKRYQEMLQKQKNKPAGVQPQFLRRKFSLMNAFVADGGSAGNRRKCSRKCSTASDALARPKHNVSMRRWQSEVWTKLRGLTRSTAASVNLTTRLRSSTAKFTQRPTASGRTCAQDRACSPPPINVSLMPNNGDANGVIIFY